MLAALEKGSFRREIADAAFVYQRDVDAKTETPRRRQCVCRGREKPIDILVVDAAVEKDKLASLKA